MCWTLPKLDQLKTYALKFKWPLFDKLQNGDQNRRPNSSSSSLFHWFLLLCLLFKASLAVSLDAPYDGGVLTYGHKILYSHRSPYFIKNHIQIEEKAKLTIEPNVTLYFAPRIGVSVFGTLIAKVSKILFENLHTKKKLNYLVIRNIMHFRPLDYANQGS